MCATPDARPNFWIELELQLRACCRVLLAAVCCGCVHHGMAPAKLSCNVLLRRCTKADIPARGGSYVHLIDAVLNSSCKPWQKGECKSAPLDPKQVQNEAGAEATSAALDAGLAPWLAMLAAGAAAALTAAVH
jgi:hypothetical protein